VRALPTLLGPASYRELMRIPPDAPAGARPGIAWGGGAPGVNACVQLEGAWEVIVLANTDPPAAEEAARNLGALLGFPREDCAQAQSAGAIPAASSFTSLDARAGRRVFSRSTHAASHVEGTGRAPSGGPGRPVHPA
jgi:hypothetical protein